MSRTITALFDSRADAEAGRDRLIAARVDADHVRIHDQSTMGAHQGAATGTTGQGPNDDTGFWSSIKNALLPDEDRYTYEEGVRRGGYLLVADVDGDEIDDAVAALENANSVDVEDRAATWRQDGWTTPTVGTNDSTSIPIVEERLVVGKREVERGGVRVRSYVAEVPVHEQVRLRQEHVQLERRPVDRDLGAADADAFRERSIEMTETSEEAVVGKTARVVEEVSLNKTADERVEAIDDTVRHTEVEVEDLSGTAGTHGTRPDKTPGF